MRTTDDLIAIADKNAWKINPNKKVVESVLRGQNKAKVEKGEYYCPCKIKKIEENICPCKNSQNEIDKDGHCHCNLFFK